MRRALPQHPSPRSPNAAFDRGFVTVADDDVVVTDALDDAARRVLGLGQQLRVR
jgi:hypothetical protein